MNIFSVEDASPLPLSGSGLSIRTLADLVRNFFVYRSINIIYYLIF